MAQHANDRASAHSVEKDLEKVDYIEVSTNKYANIGLTAEETDFYENFPEDKKKKMIRKIDFRLVPVLAVSRNEAPKTVSPLHRVTILLIHRRQQLLYLMAHIDRANIGNAKIEGMVEDLGMSGIQYNIALSLFFGQHMTWHPTL
jgi:serine kinase of HPr protein (carbohydrate metabolism regulator)